MFDLVGILHLVGRQAPSRGHFDDAEGGFEEGEGPVDTSRCAGREGATVEEQLVVASDLVDEDHRHGVALGQIGDHRPALSALSHVPG